MQTMSSRWAPALADPVLRPVTVAEAFTGPGGSSLGTWRVLDGSVGISSSNAVRRQLSSVTLVPLPGDPDGPPVPTEPGDLLFPDGFEWVISRGILYPDGSVELAALGTFLAETVTVDDSSSSAGALTIATTGSDRGATVARSGFLAPGSTDSSLPLGLTIYLIVVAQVPSFAPYFSFPPPADDTFYPATATWAAGDDPWAFCQTLAASGGYELFFDRFGICTLRPVPDPTTAPVAEVYVEGDTATFTGVSRAFTNVGVPNVIICVSQGSNVSPPIQSIWWDANPASPTFYGVSGPPAPPTGTYPTTTSKITTALATSDPQAAAIAQSAGLAALGSIETLPLKIRSNPALDVEDVIEVVRTRVGLDGSQRYVIDQLAVPLSYATEQTMTGRRVWSQV